MNDTRSAQRMACHTPFRNKASTEPGKVPPSNGDKPHFVFSDSRVSVTGRARFNTLRLAV